MFWYVVLAILILAGVTLVESFLIVFVAGLLGIGVSFKVIFFVMLRAICRYTRNGIQSGWRRRE
jgi:site-specific recombinase